MAYEFEFKEIQPQHVATVRLHTVSSNLGATFMEVLPEVWQNVTGRGIAPAGPPIARYHAYSDTGIDLEAGMPVAEVVAPSGRVQPSTLPGGSVAVTNHYGSYDKLPQAFNALAAWIAEQGREAGDGPWEVYWTDPGTEPDQSKWRTEIVWPLK